MISAQEKAEAKKKAFERAQRMLPNGSITAQAKQAGISTHLAKKFKAGEPAIAMEHQVSASKSGEAIGVVVKMREKGYARCHKCKQWRPAAEFQQSKTVHKTPFCPEKRSEK